MNRKSEQKFFLDVKNKFKKSYKQKKMFFLGKLLVYIFTCIKLLGLPINNNSVFEIKN